MKYTTIAVIYNPNSTGQSEVLARDFARRITAQKPRQKVELHATRRPGHGEQLAYTIARNHKHPLIVSSSGDGGYSDIINGVMKAKAEGHPATTGLLPAGNANDHYNTMHRGDVVRRIAEQDVRNIDLLKLQARAGGKPITRYAHSYVGFGLTPAVGLELNKTKLNRLNELWIVLHALVTVKPVRLRIGKKPRAYESVVCSNVDVMSKYLKISRASSMRDGKFEVTIFRRRNKLQLLLLLLEIATKGATEDAKTSEFTLHTVKPTLVQTDGEVLELDAHAEVVITAERQVLECII